MVANVNKKKIKTIVSMANFSFGVEMKTKLVQKYCLKNKSKKGKLYESDTLTGIHKLENY